MGVNAQSDGLGAEQARGRPRSRDTRRARRPRAVHRAPLLVLAVALLALAVGVAATLAHAAQRRSGSNGVLLGEQIATLRSGERLCQLDEIVPADSVAMQVGLLAQESGGPALLVTLRRHGRLLDRARVRSGWTGTTLRVPLRRAARDADHVDVCFQATERGERTAEVWGARTPALTGPAALNGDVLNSATRIDYYRPGRESWWAFAPVLARRLGRGRGAWGGPWIVFAIAAAALGAWLLAARVVLRTLLRDDDGHELRRTVRAVMAIAFLNAAAWSLITPAFRVPDEMGHFAYVQQLAETGRPPRDLGGAIYAPELDAALFAVRSGTDKFAVSHAGVWTPAEERRLERMTAGPLPRRGNGDVGAVDPEPPAYYALEAIPYRLGRGLPLFGRLAAMRLLSAGLAALTAALALLFVRECLPARRWAWSVGGLVAAFLPMLGFVSGGVNPDALLFAVSAALFLCLATAFRRGMTPRLALWTGGVLGLGLVTKINVLGLVPGAIVAIALAARQGQPRWNARALKLAALPLAIAAGAYLAMTACDVLLWGRSGVLAHEVAAAHSDRGGLLDQLNFMWQMYLPPLPGSVRAFPVDVGYHYWFRTFIGVFGPVEVPFPEWTYRVALALCALVGVLAGRALVAGRAAVRRRRRELLGYVLMIAGLLGLIALAELRGYTPGIAAAAQGRYLLPLLALFVALVALAARGAGERWGRSVGVTLVVVAVAWSLFGQLLSIGGFYS